MKSFALLAVLPVIISARRTDTRSSACTAEDLAARIRLQNKFAGICEDMCKEVGAYPEHCTCPNYVDTTDKTPGVMTWDELLKYMDDLSAWGEETVKGWKKEVTSALQWTKKAVRVVQVSKACMAEDEKHRAMVQHKLAGVCVDMCKEVGAYPEKCTCPKYVDTTDKTPNVVTWPELLNYMDKVEAQGADALKRWKGH
eukprot:CAMPEP_0171169500 /NCGR_PEP_ID=MMETSP0790-20130122/8244_1 /TAXON_ID=2925 /ORGANISM="Alexandrium catenella, Strain OF101" /LENGTH=197 /DNA_ID=CAMNT_0011634345 /DNA_START=73 /DNA_END=666 /DNA_ORIENTATION=+